MKRHADPTTFVSLTFPVAQWHEMMGTLVKQAEGEIDVFICMTECEWRRMFTDLCGFYDAWTVKMNG